MAYNGWVYEKVCLDETFKLSTKLDSKLSYTPCYMLCGFNLQTLTRDMNFFVLFCGWKIKI
jgi:hypothetical protein